MNDLCPICQDYSGDLEAVYGETYETVFRGCKRCLEKGLRKSEIGWAVYLIDQRAKNAIAKIVKEQEEQIEVLKTEIDTRMLNPEWQIVSGSACVKAMQVGEIVVAPSATPYFEPKAVQMGAVDDGDIHGATGNPKPFTIGAVDIAGCPQIESMKRVPNGESGELPSSTYEKGRRVNWAIFGHAGDSGRDLRVCAYNPNPVNINIRVSVWGNPINEVTWR